MTSSPLDSAQPRKKSVQKEIYEPVSTFISKVHRSAVMALTGRKLRHLARAAAADTAPLDCRFHVSFNFVLFNSVVGILSEVIVAPFIDRASGHFLRVDYRTFNVAGVRLSLSAET